MVGLKVAEDGSALASVLPLQKLTTSDAIARARKEITLLSEMLESLPRKSRVREATEAHLRQLRIQGESLSAPPPFPHSTPSPESCWPCSSITRCALQSSSPRYFTVASRSSLLRRPRLHPTQSV